ncbi:MAG: nucleotidyltransferase domain-containing protein [Candidatus Pacearchaeota archaeon]
METKITILSHFFENPNKEFYIREIARIAKINHTTVRQYLNKLIKEGLLLKSKKGLYPSYRLLLSKKTLNLKLFYNLEKIRESRLIEDLEKEYDMPVIVLFGSYAKAMDDLSSDIDICLITNIKKEINLEKYEKILRRRISLHKFTKKEWEIAKSKNKELVNNVCNGIVLSGELEVV